MKHVYCDVEITRRKHFHLVGDWVPWEVPDWKDRLFGRIVLWLAEQGHSRYMLHVEDRIFAVQMTEVDATEGEPQWPNLPAP